MFVGEIAAMGELGVNTDWLLTGHGDMIRGTRSPGLSEADERNLPSHGASLDARPALTPDEAARIYRTVRIQLEEVGRQCGWRPPRLTEKAMKSLLFSIALGREFGEKTPTNADLVEFFDLLRQDMERRNAGSPM